MIYLFYGSDIEKTRAKAFEWVAKARAKEPNLAYSRLSREELTSAALEEVALSGGLFVRRLLALIDNPFPVTRRKEEEEDPAMREEPLEAFLDLLAISDNAIVILAPNLPPAKAKKLATKAKVEYRFDKASASVREGRSFNSKLVNALAARSREKLWLEIVRALRAGDEPEMLHGLLHWKARDMMLKGNRVWSTADARALSLALIALIQNARHNGRDLSSSLEHFALSI